MKTPGRLLSRSLFLVMVPGVLAVAFDARAADEPPAAQASTNDHPRKLLALTFSPLHLVGGPIFEVTGEARVTDRIGVAAIAGAGKYSDTVNGTEVSADVWELGAQFRGYVLGDFRHGMQLGAEVLYLHMDTTSFIAQAHGLAVGPFVGYKYQADVGFTFDAQLGAEHIGAKASSGGSSATDGGWIPLVNLNVGWSF